MPGGGACSSEASGQAAGGGEAKDQLPVIIGFDAEWMDMSFEDDEVPPGTSNRILSWQLFLLDTNTGRSCGVFEEAKSGRKASRKMLSTLIGLVVTKAIKEGVVEAIPPRIILAAHFCRADLSTVRDFSNFKRKLGAVRTTYATTERPLYVRIPTDRGTAPASVSIADTMLLSPNGPSLAALGEALGLPKVELPEGFSKERMDLFLAEHREEFIQYAMTDAEIAARWTARVLEIVRRECGVRRPLATLGAVAVEMIRREMKAASLETDTFLGRKPGRR